ncbi:hypothetical protein UFOVP237_53 [uncultured Caudovirales phage]|uniref:Uncharacterized protein n=1 Tax=uncultured Caudovirales phage TaxID=2100421 RepID=A0A6J7WPU1_9CAUD|nr:hypothetical protein UFOVP237_53 [uncultured Caudovirales phage]
MDIIERRRKVMEYTKEDLKKDAGLPHLPTDLTYELRMAVTGHRKDDFLSYGYQWTDKPHRLVYDACREIERQADEIERLRGIINDDRLEGAADEIERLRKEVERIADLTERWPDFLISQVNEIARAALKEGE